MFYSNGAEDTKLLQTDLRFLHKCKVVVTCADSPVTSLQRLDSRTVAPMTLSKSVPLSDLLEVHEVPGLRDIMDCTSPRALLETNSEVRKHARSSW